MLLNELRRLHKHATRAACGVEHLAAVRFNDFDHQPNHRARREELPSALAFAQRKVTQKVLIDLTEHIARSIERNVIEEA